MKKILFLIMLCGFVISCADEDDNGNIINEETEINEYILRSAVDGTSLGEVILENNTDNTITINVIFEEPVLAQDIEVHLHSGTAAETGEILLNLNNVDVETGISTTNFSTWNDASSAIYEQLMILDGYIDVHYAGETDFFAFTDIGLNELSGTTQIYNLAPENESVIEGIVTFEKRFDNTTLAVFQLINSSASAQYSASLYADNALEGENVVFDFSNLNNSQMSLIQIDSLMDGTEITFDELMNFDGHIKLFETINDVTTLIGKTDVGSNILTGMTETYNLVSVNDSGINGVLLMEERINGEMLVTVDLENTIPNEEYSAVIFTGPTSSSEEEMIIITLNPVIGTNGISKTNISIADDETEVTYDDLLGLNAHIRIFSPDNILVAHGDIGINAE